MMDEPNQQGKEENFKAENDFLKMKLMLEHGASFGGYQSDKNTLPPGMENQFLNSIIAFEQQFSGHKTIILFDKIGTPGHFKPVSELSEENIEQAWKELSDYLSEYNIFLDVCSPNIKTRELYRFVVEELFIYELDDMDLPGWSYNFIYDEFHPDPVYDNSRMTKEDLLDDIFSKKELCWDLHYAKDGFSFNDIPYSDFKDYCAKINGFKSLYDEISLLECGIDSCIVTEKESFVTGNYNAAAQTGNDEVIFSGNLKVKFVLSDMGYWDMKEIWVKGLNIA